VPAPRSTRRASAWKRESVRSGSISGSTLM
jgi:hypothetical protein